MTDKHDGPATDSPVALVSTNSTAHILDQVNPSINPYNLNNDALVKDLAHCIDVGDHGNMNDATTTASSASRRLHDLQPNKHSELKAYKPIKQEDDDKLQNVISGVAYSFNSGASTDYSADVLKFKTVLDEATSSAKPSAPSNQHPDIHHLLHTIPKFQGIHIPAHELAACA